MEGFFDLEAGWAGVAGDQLELELGTYCDAVREMEIVRPEFAGGVAAGDD